jgi:GLPGLI family protein
MNKLVKATLIGAAGISLFAFSLPNNGFEGIITYSMSFGSSGNANSQMASMMQGSNRKVYVKGDKTRTEVNTGMYKSVTITDMKTKEEITLVDMNGNKYEIKPTDKTKTADDKPAIKLIDSTKTIAGYKCNAAVVTITSKKDGQTYNSTVFYSDQLPYSEDMGQFKGLKGCPLQFSIKQQGMDITIMAQSIEKKTLSDSLFVIPAKGYKVVASREEMMKDMQENMGGSGQ